MGAFRFKGFEVDDCGCGMKICSDSVLLAAWFLPQYAEARNIIDVGAGSGVLSLLAARICSEAHVTGIEIDPAAFDASCRNFKSSPWSERLLCVNCDINAYIPTSLPDIIISNPPYFTNGAIAPDVLRAVARHQSTLTYSTLLSLALAAGGHLGMVTPADAFDDIIFEAEMRRRKPCRICRVHTSPAKDAVRILWDFSDAGEECREETLDLRDADGRYSDTYRRLVEPYYLKLAER